MKQLMITIRPSKYYDVRAALIEKGFNSMSVKDVQGKEKNSVEFEAVANKSKKNKAHYDHPFIAKKMIEIFARDEDCDEIINTVLSVAKTDTPGDGKIFVIPVYNAVRIRTGEKDVNAIM